MTVEIATLAPKPVEQLAELVGTVKSRRATTLRPQAEGIVTEIFVKSGDRVGKGAPILDVDDASQRAAVASLQSLRAARGGDRVGADPAAPDSHGSRRQRRREAPLHEIQRARAGRC